MNGLLVTYLSLRWIAMGSLSEGTEPVPAERGYLVLTLKSSYLNQQSSQHIKVLYTMIIICYTLKYSRYYSCAYNMAQYRKMSL